eukprot:6472044-Amphidinium_carterae.1
MAVGIFRTPRLRIGSCVANAATRSNRNASTEGASSLPALISVAIDSAASSIIVEELMMSAPEELSCAHAAARAKRWKLSFATLHSSLRPLLP